VVPDPEDDEDEVLDVLDVCAALETVTLLLSLRDGFEESTFTANTLLEPGLDEVTSHVATPVAVISPKLYDEDPALKLQPDGNESDATTPVNEPVVSTFNVKVKDPPAYATCDELEESERVQVGISETTIEFVAVEVPETLPLEAETVNGLS
jgi:hypothetical protein